MRQSVNDKLPNRITDKVPNSLKYIVGRIYYHIPKSLKYGKEFNSAVKLINEAKSWTQEQINRYHFNELKRVLILAYENTDFYNESFKKVNFNPRTDFNCLEDINKVPFVTKDEIVKHGLKMINKNFPEKYLNFETSGGSTGLPTGMWFDNRKKEFTEWAYILDQWGRVGYKDGDKCVLLRDAVVENVKENKKYWKMNWANNCLIMSSFHLNDDTIEIYLDKLRKFKPKYMQAYPSVLSVLCTYMKKRNLKLPSSIQAIMCPSEMLYDWQRKLFKEVLGVRAFSHYGHTEKGCLAAECEFSSMYHIFPTYGFTELLNKSNSSCSQEDEQGEVVITNFFNDAMPLIRCRTRDLATHTNKLCRCGRNHKLMKTIDGRLQELMVTKSGEKVPMVCLNMYDHIFDNVKQFQFQQDTPGKLNLKLVPLTTLKQKEVDDIYSELIKKLHSNVELNVSVVESIPRTPLGKYRYLIQNIPLD